jgi:RNA polymerase sigma factor (sigma-70 family)
MASSPGGAASVIHHSQLDACPCQETSSLWGAGWTVITRYYRELLNFCLRKVKDHDTAADLAQESYARVLAMQQAGQAVLEPRALLRQVALNAKIDMDRRAEIRQHDNIDELDEAVLPTQPQHLQPEEIYASSQAAEAYLKAIEALPTRCREAFCLYAFDELPNKEIAQRMGISLSMVNQYISRGKLACAACRQTQKGSHAKE